MPSTFFFSDSPSTVTSTDAVITSSSYGGRTSTLTSVQLGNEAISIGSLAFHNCSSLASITIPNSVTSIQNSAFLFCASLSSIDIPSSVTSIGSVFVGCTSLISINVNASNLNYTSSNGILFNKNLTTLICYPAGKSGNNYTIPDSVTNIGSYAFYGSTFLTSITMPNSITSIGIQSFTNCALLSSINIPNSITSIGNSAFFGCSSLLSINIPNLITSIENSVFQNCTLLTNITIPSSVRTIGSGAFVGCGFVSISIPSSVTSIGNSLFLNCTSLTSVTIPNSITSIGSSTFSGCISLVSITIPSSVTSIGSLAFFSCTSLTSITIPSSITNIADQVFYNCNSLNRINFLGNPPTLGLDIFGGTTPANLKVYRYSTKSGWSSTFGGKDVLLIDMPSKGLRTFGFSNSSSGKVSIKKTSTGSGKITIMPRIYVYKATGTDLTPNINGLRFYDSGLTENGLPIYYDETNTYKIRRTGINWVINTIEPSSGLWIKGGLFVLGIYSPIGGTSPFLGNPSISAI